jgi:hypothetical protein
MSTEELPQGRSKWKLIAYVTGAGVVILISFAVVCASRTVKPPSTGSEIAQTDTLESVKSGLAKTTDYGTCKNARQQLNLYLSQHPERKPPTLTDAQRKYLTEKCLDDPSDLTEIEGGSFTLLDANHLDACFLFRDAAQSLEVNGFRGAEQAVAAFRWVVRQVRLRSPSRPGLQTDADPQPPEFVVRRGSGTAEERALVFLALLRQLGIQGCLIGSPGSDASHPFYWACGALVDATPVKEGDAAKQILLFDHRMGLPLPGPQGDEILTLSALCADPELLKSLTVDPKYPYDVNAENVATVEIHLVAPLSALAPRMAFLQKELLAPAIKGQLTLDIEESHKQFVKAAPKTAGREVPVRVATHLTGLLRRFLPPDEGGTDKVFPLDPRFLPGLYTGPDRYPLQMLRKRLFEFELVRWDYFPQDLSRLALISELGQRTRGIFQQMFVSFYLEPRRPRDLVLRGRFDEAVDYLVAFRDQLKDYRKRYEDADNIPEFQRERAAWPDRATSAYADLIRAEKEGPAAVAEAKQRVDAVWKEGNRIVSVLVEGQAAKPLDAVTTYLLAQAKHEQAARLQARIDKDRAARREINPDEIAAARKAWETTLGWWKDQDLATATVLAPAARWHLAEAHLALGDKAAARAFLEDLDGNLSPLEKTARLYWASKLTNSPP